MEAHEHAWRPGYTHSKKKDGNLNHKYIPAELKEIRYGDNIRDKEGALQLAKLIYEKHPSVTLIMQSKDGKKFNIMPAQDSDFERRFFENHDFDFSPYYNSEIGDWQYTLLEFY